MEYKPTAVVAAGGAVGAVARYALAVQFPGIWTIAAINVAGSLLLGLVAALLGPDRLWRLFLGVGVLGGYTTSAWAAGRSAACCWRSARWPVRCASR